MADDPRVRTFAAARAQHALVLAFLLVVTLVATLAQPGTAHAASPVPTPPALPTAIDAFPAWQGVQLCDPVARSGPLKLEAVLAQTYGSTSFGITRSCTGSTGTSEHNEGRALDWMISGTSQKANAEALLAWLFADDAAGNHFAMARRMGIMYVIWNNKMFRIYDTARGWTEYSGCLSLPSSSYDTTCHRNHVHFSFSWDGAAARTSYWSGVAVTAPNCSLPPATVGALPTLPDGGLELVPLPPARLLDTAAGVGVSTRCRLAQDGYTGENRRIDVQVAGRGGVPTTGATAAILSLQVTSPNAPTKLYVRPAGDPSPRLRAVTTYLGLDGLGSVTVPLGADGKVSFLLSTGAADLSVDVLGYYQPVGGAGQRFHPTDPVRVLNTAPGTAAPLLEPGESRVIDVAGHAGVPASGATAVTVALSIFDPTKAGGVTLFSPDDPPPPASLLSVYSPTAGRRTNLVVAKLSAGGQLVIRNDSAVARDVAVDVEGWWAPSPVDGGSLYKIVPATSVVDTTLDQGIVGPLTAGRTATATLTGKGGVPTGAVTAVALQTTTVAPTETTFLLAWRGGGTQPSTRVASPIKSRDLTVYVVAPLASGQVALKNGMGSVDLRAYTVGYWYLSSP